ncbi:MAG: hypothetical protein K8L97_07670 [Anaerolineae bacterium]|nr:hypothetical protein [Anaerolineae bacterium]
MKKNDELDEMQLDSWIAEEFPILSVGSVPKKFRHLIGLASEWGLTDDLLRFRLLQKSLDKDLENLENSVRPHYGELHEWLANAESEITDEYIAYSYLRLAADEAKMILMGRLTQDK